MKLKLSDLKVPQSFAQTLGARKMLANVPLCKGQRQTFYRASDREGHSPDLFVLEQKEGGSESFLIAPNIIEVIGKDAVAKRLYYCVDQFGNPFFWPVKIVFGDEKLDSWNESAHRAAQIAKEKWIRITPNQQVRAYDVFEALGAIPEPKWPDKSIEELIDLAFADRYITTLDHPMVKRLQGFV